MGRVTTNRLVMGNHSKLLSPSGSGLWLVCTQMPKAFIDSGIVDVSSPAADRGTLQHTYAEKLRKNELELKCPDDLDSDEWDQVKTAVESIDDFLKEEGTYDTDRKQCREYLEVEVAFNDWRKECFGTVDFIRLDIRLRKLYVFDYKFGRVNVLAKDNSQLSIYALAYIEQSLTKQNVNLKKLVDEVVLGIAQPMISKKLETARVPLEDLFEWDETVLQPAQRKILEGKGELVPGNHCVEKYCKVRRSCVAYNAKGAETMDSFVALYNDEVNPTLTVNSLSIEDLAELLDKAPLIEGVLADARERAMELLNSGSQVPGYKIVEGQGKRVWSDEAAADVFLLGQKIKAEDRYTKKFITYPQAEKLLKEAEKLSSPRTIARFLELKEYKPGKDTLVPESDPRPAIVRQENVDAEVEDTFGLDDGFDDIDSLMASLDDGNEGADDLDALLETL